MTIIWLGVLMSSVVSALAGLWQTLADNPMRLIAHAATIAVGPAVNAIHSEHIGSSRVLLHFLHTNISEKHSSKYVVGYIKQSFHCPGCSVVLLQQEHCTSSLSAFSIIMHFRVATLCCCFLLFICSMSWIVSAISVTLVIIAAIGKWEYIMYPRLK